MSKDVKEYGKPEINFIMQAFTDYIGLQPTPKQQQRQYCHSLVKLLGETTEDVVRYAISIQDDYYAPTITSPKDLYYKLSKVMAYYKKQEGNNGKVVSL